jgi:hypothetical protein
MEGLTRVKGEVKRVLCLMKGGCEDCSCLRGNPASIAALEWVLDVIEHEEAKDDDDTI